jgi:RNA polymerase sigma-70 factor, ECF subfamily
LSAAPIEQELVSETGLSPGEVTGLLRRWRDGHEGALDDLTPLIYAELRLLARGRLAGEQRACLSPTELVHEAFLRLSDQNQPLWANRAHFYYIAARLMRQVLVDAARRERAIKRGGGGMAVALEDAGPLVATQGPTILGIHEALAELAAMDERKSRVLEMRFFAGMTVEGIAEVEQVSIATVGRDVRAATAWLRVWLKEHV